MNISINIHKWAILSLMCWACSACTDNIDLDPDKSGKDVILPITLELNDESDLPDLEYKLYIFHQASGRTDYECISTLSLTAGVDSLLPFKPVPDDLYRFLFVATPAGNPEICVESLNGEELGFGMKWQDIIINQTGKPLSTENYYGILQQTGKEIIETGRVNGLLKRLVGQMVFLFYKAAPDKADTPVDADSQKARSVFDRVYSIEATYSKYPYAITFQTDTILHPLYHEKEDQVEPLKQSWKVTLDTQLQAEIPQPDNQLETLDEITGAVSMKGACFLPAENQVMVNMTFKYYDTLPICGKTELHTSSCYVENELALQIKPENEEGVSIRNGYFTVNRVAITLDRVIDISHQSDLNVNTNWNVE